MGEVNETGFRWDTGPSVITMRWVFEDFFSSLNRRLNDYLELVPVEPLTRYFFSDGAQLDATRDLSRMVEQIGAWDEHDISGYLAYLSYAARLHQVTGPAFIYGSPPSLASFRRVRPQDWLRFDPLRSMQRAIQGYVRSPRLRQVLGRFATYVGANPYQAPATLNVIAHVEMTGGVWYPRGGIYTIARAFERLALENGINILTNHQASQIVVKDRKVNGVLCTNGQYFPAQTVISDLDVGNVYQRLLEPGQVSTRRLRAVTRTGLSCSGFILLLGIRGTHPSLAHHNIFFSSDYRREFQEIFSQKIPPSEPTVYLAISSKTDPEHAPPGCENWFLLVNVPPLDGRIQWETLASRYRQVVLNRLASFGLEVEGNILTEKIITPADLERMNGARQGALYGTSSNNRLAAFRRPHNRSADVEGLYFCGGTTHPGGGVPMVMLSAKSVFDLVLKR
jgi:phytoene desaturase